MTELEITQIAIGLIVPLMFLLGNHLGKRDTRFRFRREIEAGREYLDALREAERGCMRSQRLEVKLVVRRPATPSREATSKLPDHVVDGDDVCPECGRDDGGCLERGLCDRSLEPDDAEASQVDSP